MWITKFKIVQNKLGTYSKRIYFCILIAKQRYFKDMTLTNAIWNLLDTDRKLVFEVALALNTSEANVLRRIEARSDNLTKIAAIKAIEKYTGLPQDEIIETTNATA